MTKTYLQRDWKRFVTHSEATSTTGKIKIDDDGNKVEWKHGGKRVEAKIVK